MGFKEIGCRGKTAVIAGVSGAMYGGSEIAERGGATAEVLGIINDLGKIGLAWSGVLVVRMGIDKMGVKNKEQRRKDLLARLPDLKDPVSPLRITSAVDRRLEEKPNTAGMLDAFSWTRFADEWGVSDGDDRAYVSLVEDVDYIVEQMAEAERNPEAGPDDSRYLLAHRAALLLDQAAPISDNCTKTPQNIDKDKTWYDYLHDRALSLNVARNEAESAWM